MKKILLFATVLLIYSCKDRYRSNLHKLGEFVEIEGDTIQVIDLNRYYLILSDGTETDVNYPIIKP